MLVACWKIRSLSLSLGSWAATFRSQARSESPGFSWCISLAWLETEIACSCLPCLRRKARSPAGSVG